MILVHPVVEIRPFDGFTLWPVAELAPYGFLHLDHTLDPYEVGTAMMSIIGSNDYGPLDDDLPPPPSEPFDGFLHGFLIRDELFAAGGLRVTDTANGTTLVPGCCVGLEEWRDWLGFLAGETYVDLGHDPTPRAEHSGETIRLTVDTERGDSPVIESSITELRPLLEGVEHDLSGFLRIAAAWTEQHLPDHSAPVTRALARVLAMA